MGVPEGYREAVAAFPPKPMEPAIQSGPAGADRPGVGPARRRGRALLRGGRRGGRGRYDHPGSADRARRAARRLGGAALSRTGTWWCTRFPARGSAWWISWRGSRPTLARGRGHRAAIRGRAVATEATEGWASGRRQQEPAAGRHRYPARHPPLASRDRASSPPAAAGLPRSPRGKAPPDRTSPPDSPPEIQALEDLARDRRGVLPARPPPAPPDSSPPAAAPPPITGSSRESLQLHQHLLPRLVLPLG